MVDRDLLEKCDPELLNRGMFVPLHLTDTEIYVAISNPWDTIALDTYTQQFPGSRGGSLSWHPPRPSPRSWKRSSARRAPACRNWNPSRWTKLEISNEDFDVSSEFEEPIARLVATMLSDGIRQRASDVHIKCERDRVHYSYRIDGDMGKKIDIPMKLKDRVDAFLLNLMGIPPEERAKRPGISGRLTVRYLRRKYRPSFRTSSHLSRAITSPCGFWIRATSRPSSAWADWPSMLRPCLNWNGSWPFPRESS